MLESGNVTLVDDCEWLVQKGKKQSHMWNGNTELGPNQVVLKYRGGRKKRLGTQPHRSSYLFDNQILVLLLKPERRATPIGPDLIECLDGNPGGEFWLIEVA